MALKTWLVVGLVSVILAGCGGGGGGGGSSSTPAPAPAVVATPKPAGCAATTTGSGNTQALCISGGPTGGFTNVVLTSVTVCAPQSTTACTTIPNVQVDTGSSGLRIFHSQVSTLGLPPQLVSNGDSFYECAGFADGVVWGSVNKADISIAGEKASGISVQVILDDVPTPAVPSDCLSQGTEENTPTLIGANGIIGIGLFQLDCGAACALSSTPFPQYYDCTSTNTCSDADIPVAQQIPNPVSAFATDNNGVVLQIPAVPDAGYPQVAGTLIFGINTQTNNQLGSTPVIDVPATGNNAGSFSLAFNSTTYSQSFIDSGSSAYFFNDASISDCPSSSVAKFYLCPGSSAAISLQGLAVVITGSNGASASSTLKLANAQFLFDQANAANLFVFDDLGAPAGSVLPNAFDLGVPFFFGKSVYTGIETSTAPAGPFFAWAPL